jgi:hypothetical protein
MKKILYLLVLTSILLVSVMAQATSVQIQDSTPGVTNSNTVITGASYLKAILVSQDPSLADPGAYVNVLFQIENLGTDNANNVTVELIPEYPFSLNPGVSAINQIGTINGLAGNSAITGSSAFQVKYKLRIDDNAVNGDNEIKLKYSEGDGSTYKIATFNISVTKPRTDFDVVAQDSTTLAIANIGANTASSVIVRIPDQPNFRVNGTSATIIGNLNAGDYTLATFQLFQIRTSNTSSGPSNLTVEISYTDTLGIRRTLDKYVPFGFTSGFSGNITGRLTQRGTQTISNGMLYIAIGAVGIVIVVVVLKLRSRKKK